MRTIFLSLGLLGALVGVAADICLLHSPDAVYERFDYQFLLDISPKSLLWGHYLGIFGIPFEAFGLWALVDGLWAGRQQLKGIIMFALGWLLVVGVAYHAAIAWAADWLRQGHDIDTVRHLFEPLGDALAALFLALCLPFTYLVARRQTQYPHHLLLFSPLLAYPACIALYLAAPTIGRYTAVAGFNLSLALFFAALLAIKPQKP